jgi:hypothetical protein
VTTTAGPFDLEVDITLEPSPGSIIPSLLLRYGGMPTRKRTSVTLAPPTPKHKA